MVASRACLVGMRRNAKSLGCHWHPRGKPRRALRGAMSSRRKSGGGRATKETLRTNKQSNTYDCTCAFAWHKTPAVIQRMPAESLANARNLRFFKDPGPRSRTACFDASQGAGWAAECAYGQLSSLHGH
jgi:hypothetical protein